MLVSRLASLFRNTVRKNRVERALDDELRAFVDLRTDEYMSSGMARHEARRKALLECGGVEQVKESVRDVRAGALLEQLWLDLRFAARMLRKNPGFAAVAVLTIALGIGVNAGIFTIINAVAMQPLQVSEAGRVVAIYQNLRGGAGRFVNGEESFFSYPEYLEYRDHNDVFSGLFAYATVSATLSVGGEQAHGQLASCNYFDVLRAPMEAGRGFHSTECASEGSGAVVVLSNNTWRSEFGADPGIVGKIIRVNRQPLQVIGVAGENVRGTDFVPAAFWIPVTMQHAIEGGEMDRIPEDNLSWLVMMGRLKDGVSLDKTRAQLALIAAHIDQRHPGRTTTLSVNTATLLGTPEAKTVLVGLGSVLLAAVGLVLLIVCANVANLMLARATGRRREIAVRLAVGAGRGRIVRQLLTESLLLAFLGGAMGLVIAVWSSRTAMVLLMNHLPPQLPRIFLNLDPDLRVFAYTFLLTLLTGLAFGLVPALQATKPDLNRELRRESSEGEHARSGRSIFRHALVAAQVAFCTLLLISAGLLVRGLMRVETRDPGFLMDHVSVASFNLAGEGYTAERAATFHHQLLDTLAAAPGVDAVADAGITPIDGGRTSEPYSINGSPWRSINLSSVSPEYFSLLAIPLVRGRNFTRAEAAAAAPVAIVTESTARAMWPGEEPVGKRLMLHPKTQLEVIGVAKDTDTVHLGHPDEPFLYLLPAVSDQLRLKVLVHSRTDPAATAETIRAAVHNLDPGLTVRVAPLQENIGVWATPSLLGVTFASVMAGLALLIASIGIYGTVAYSVGKRTREIGIRIALGAADSDILRMVLRQIMRPVVAGAAVGLVASFAASSLLTLLLFGVSRFDAAAYLSVVAFLISVALLASYLPARRALRVDPMSAIRHE